MQEDPKRDIQKEFIEGLRKLEEELGIKITQNLAFPMYNTYPDDLQLAINIINKHNPVFSIKAEIKDGQ